MKLLFLGAPRTATNSIFHLLKNHPKISPTSVKEPFNTSLFKNVFPHRYFSEFKLIKEDTEILMDGTPCAYSYFKDKVIQIPIEKKIIYPIRNPFDRIYSTIKQTIITNNMKTADVKFPPYIMDNLNIDTNKLMDYLPYMMDSVHIEKALYVTDDVFMFRFDKLNIKDIWNFIELDPIEEKKLEKLNEMKIWYKKPYNDIRNTVDLFWKKNRKEIAKLILNDLNKIKKYVNVEDWIEETNNILFNV